MSNRIDNTAAIGLPNSSGAEIVEHLRDIELRLANAWVAGDRSLIDRFLADDWSVIDLAGRVLTKAEVLEEAFDSHDRKIASMQIDNVRVRSFGDWAIVRLPENTGAKRQKLPYDLRMCFPTETECGKSSLRRLHYSVTMDS